MPRARRHLVCVEDTPYYHVTSRCVRRAFLCGEDRFTGKSYEHRRGWIEDRIRILSSLFSIETCAYAVMNNHYHLVVRIDTDEPKRWSDKEVIERWTALFKGPLLVQRYRQGDGLSEAEYETLRSIIAVYRSRLGSLSWFMKCLNEPIARRANAEDRCTGHFWEARFHSQALCSKQAVITAMAYVDLNPVRAGIAKTPESSEYTSIRARQQKNTEVELHNVLSAMMMSGELHHFGTPVRPLMPFARAVGTQTDVQWPTANTLPMREHDYLELVDVFGRVLRRGKRGRIEPGVAPILERLGLSVDDWLQGSTEFRKPSQNGEWKTKKTA